MSPSHGSDTRTQIRTGDRVGAPDAVEQQETVIVDWVSFTLHWPAGDVKRLVRFVGSWLAGYIGTEANSGVHGYTASLDLLVGVRGHVRRVGRIAYGGESQRERVFVEVEGSGCALVHDFGDVARSLQWWASEGRRPRLTRVDLAFDDHDGRWGVEAAHRLAASRQFRSAGGGAVPVIRLEGDWVCHRGAGRTVYIGRGNGKQQLTVYEKGKQLGDNKSPWTRWELRFRNADCVLPFRMLVDRLEFFAGAYPVLAKVARRSGTRIRRVVDSTTISVNRALEVARNQAGRAVNLAVEMSGGNYAEAARLLVRDGLPARLDHSSVAAAAAIPGAWDQVREGVQRKWKAKRG